MMFTKITAFLFLCSAPMASGCLASLDGSADEADTGSVGAEGPTVEGAVDTAQADINWEHRSSAVRPYRVYGDIGKAWESEGREGGPLGSPTSDEQPSGSNGDRVRYFEHGSILWVKNNAEILVHVYNRRFTYRIPRMDFSGDVTGGDGFAVSIHRNGAWTFQGHFHDGGSILFPVPESTHMAMGFQSPDGTVFAFENHSSVSPFNRDHSWAESGRNSAIEAEWSNLERGPIQFGRQASTKFFEDVDWAKVFTVVVSTVIKLVT